MYNLTRNLQTLALPIAALANMDLAALGEIGDICEPPALESVHPRHILHRPTLCLPVTIAAIPQPRGEILAIYVKDGSAMACRYRVRHHWGAAKRARRLAQKIYDRDLESICLALRRGEAAVYKPGPGGGTLTLGEWGPVSARGACKRLGFCLPPFSGEFRLGDSDPADGTQY